MSRVPAPYDRKHIFGSESSNDPSRPIQGFNLDAEYNAVEVALDETQARLAEIQRDDGQLANDSVGLDQIQDDAFIEINNDAANAAQDVIDAGIIEIEAIKEEAEAAADEAQAAADAAAACRDQSCACAAAAEDSAEAAEDSAEVADAEAGDAAASADLARYYYEQMANAMDALAPDTVQFVTSASTPTWPLPVSVPDEEFIDVHVDGLLLPPTAYSVAGNVITFTPPIATGKTVVIKIAGNVQIMQVTGEDWGLITEIPGAFDDWGSVAA